MTNADNERVDIAEKRPSPRVEPLEARSSFLTDSRFLEIVLPLLGGLGIAILTALIMRYV